MPKIYNFAEARAFLGITESQLRNALRVKRNNGKITQTFVPELGKPGSGNSRALTESDLKRLKRFFEALEKLREARKELRKN